MLTTRKLVKAVLAGAAGLALGCGLSDYPVLTDERGDYSDVIRTGHKAYVTPAWYFDAAYLYPDGSDNMISMVYQNQYGDQKLYTFNNYDPTASVLFLDQTYCDWRYNGCPVAVAWNPHSFDNLFDYEYFPDCSGARSFFGLFAVSTRFGECGDARFTRARQDVLAEFAGLATTTWRGEAAYVMPLDSNHMSTTFTSAGGLTTQAPIYGQFNAIVTNDLQVVVPMTPNARHELRWLQSWVNENGHRATVNVTYGGVNISTEVVLRPSGIAQSLKRF